MKLFNRRQKYKINLIIVSVILVGFITISLINTLTYSKIIKEDIKNISKLSSSNIYSEINNELIKPIFVSLTMANDQFLKDWLKEEQEQEADSLVNYLEGLKNKYDYNSVFMISEETKAYYHYKGVHKSVDQNDTHDQWYFAFVDSGKLYDLDVDIDQADNNALTVFVNCRIENDAGELLGVVGVGLRMDSVQKILGTFEDAYDLEAFLVDQKGIVQVHTNSSLIESYNIHDNQIINGLSEDIFSNKISLETYRFNEFGIDGYLITRYVEDLDWTLMVKKDTSVLRRTLYGQMGEVLVVVLIVAGLVILISNYLINSFQTKMLEMAKTDELTTLPNRRGFNQVLYEALKDSESTEKRFMVFILDIDNFKQLNDKHGHLYGDKVITLIAHQARRSIGNGGTVARWGGDEFAGIIYSDINKAEEILGEFMETIKNNKQYGDEPITLSMGLTESKFTDTPDIIIGRADRGLYDSKKSGKGKITKIGV